MMVSMTVDLLVELLRILASHLWELMRIVQWLERFHIHLGMEPGGAMSPIKPWVTHVG